MKNKLILLPLLVASLSLGGCDNAPSSDKVDQNGKLNMFYRVKKHGSTIYTISSSGMTAAEYTLASSLQGIVSQSKAQIYIIEDKDDQSWLDDAKTRYNLNYVPVATCWDMLNIFGSYIKDSKYVLYTIPGTNGVSYQDQSINYATTVAAVDNYLMVDVSLENIAISKGLTLGKDVRSWTSESTFNQYKDKLTTKYVIHQNPGTKNLRDYAIAGKAFTFYSDYEDGSDNIRETVLTWADDNAPVLGWTENEVSFVTSNSLLKKVTVAADWSANLSFYSSLERGDKVIQSHLVSSKKTADPTKHYVCIVMSDGDNIQWLSNGFASSNLYYGSPYRGDFKMTWTISPSLYDVAPNILNYLYDNATENDEFIAGPSGVGYVNPAEYNDDGIKDYAAYTAGYMKACDMSVMNCIDGYMDESAYDEFAKYDQIKGGLLSIGDYYIEGEGVIWSNDKPFMPIRETLWRADGGRTHNQYYGYTERVAQRINNYKVDPTSIEGYTVVVCHAWSIGTMQYIARFVDQLDDHVELVTASEMIQLVTDNVPHINVDQFDDIKASDYRQNDLCPISSEQYRVKDLKDLEVNTTKKFLFETAEVANKWHFNNGGLQYDFAGFDKESKKIKLDGSDLSDTLDGFPNSWMYSKFNITDNDKVLELKVNSGDNADTNFRVRAIKIVNGAIVSKTLQASEYNKQLNSDGYFLLDEQSPSTFHYDLTEFINSDVIISIEQDDSGEGSGEIVNVNKVAFMKSTDFVSELDSWNIDQIMDEWTTSGKVVKHSEGVCLENFGSESSISCKVIVPTNKSSFYISVRKFIRTGGQSAQDLDSKIVLKVNGNIVKANYAQADYISVTLNDPRQFSYDLSAFTGQTVTISLTNIAGEHACFNSLSFK